MDHLTEQDAGLLEQAASMLEEHAEEQRTRGNCSTAEGAACSAHAIRRLAPALLRAGRGGLAQIEEPASREHTQARMEAECNDSLERYSRALPMSSMESKIYEIGFSSGWSRRGAGAAPAAVVPQGEYPPLPSNISHVMRRIRRCEAEPAAQIVLEHAMRAYFDLGRLPAAVAGSDREDRAAWFALAMGAAASIEDAANCLRDKDAQKAAMGAATHVHESCNKLWWAAPALEAPAAPSRVDVNELAQLLFGAWAKAEPEHGVTKHPMSYWASFCDMARATLAAAPQAPAAPVDDLAALVKQLVQALRKAAPNHVLPAKALDYLRRQDLLGSPLRSSATTDSQPTTQET